MLTAVLPAVLPHRSGPWRETGCRCMYLALFRLFTPISTLLSLPLLANSLLLFYQFLLGTAGLILSYRPRIIFFFSSRLFRCWFLPLFHLLSVVRFLLYNLCQG